MYLGESNTFRGLNGILICLETYTSFVNLHIFNLKRKLDKTDDFEAVISA